MAAGLSRGCERAAGVSRRHAARAGPAQAASNLPTINIAATHTSITVAAHFNPAASASSRPGPESRNRVILVLLNPGVTPEQLMPSSNPRPVKTPTRPSTGLDRAQHGTHQRQEQGSPDTLQPGNTSRCSTKVNRRRPCTRASRFQLRKRRRAPDAPGDRSHDGVRLPGRAPQNGSSCALKTKASCAHELCIPVRSKPRQEAREVPEDWQRQAGGKLFAARPSASQGRCSSAPTSRK